jgi:hypothetical protein
VIRLLECRLEEVLIRQGCDDNASGSLLADCVQDILSILVTVFEEVRNVGEKRFGDSAVDTLRARGFQTTPREAVTCREAWASMS